MSRHSAPLPRITAFCWPGAMLVCSGLLALAVTHSAVVNQLDAGLLGDVRNGAPVADRWILALTSLGDTHVVLVVTAVAAAVLLGARYVRMALALVLSIAATEVAVAIIKGIVTRPRPPAAEAVTSAAGFSFPSGHAAATTAIAAVLVFYFARSRSWSRRLLVAVAGLLLPALIGVSRVYLGVHYPTDVIAGWLIGATIAVASLLLVFRPARQSL
jgi:undecaprenyl-diphosphatase